MSLRPALHSSAQGARSTLGVALGAALALLLACPAAARQQQSLRDLRVPVSRVPDWYTAADNGFPVDTSGWQQYDVTSSADVIAATGGRCAPLGRNDGQDDAPNLECISNNIGDSGTVLFFPAGQYDFDSTHSTPGNFYVVDFGSDNLLIKGEGIGRTIFEFGSGGSLVVQCDDRGGAYFCEPRNHLWSRKASWTGGYTRGTTVLQVSDNSGLAPGDWILIGGNPNPASPPTGGGARFRHLTRIAAVGAGTITLDRPLLMDWTWGGNEIFTVASRMPDRVGFEDIEMRPAGSTHDGAYLQMITVTRPWVRHVKFGSARSIHAEFGVTARGWIQGNIFDQLTIDANGGHSSLKLRGFQHGVVEDNAFHDLRVGIELDAGAHPNSDYGDFCCTIGSVIAYNYFFPVSHWGDPNLLEDDGRDGCITPSDAARGRHIFNHAGGSHGNLLEGNHVWCHINWDEFWNAAQELTIYRNRAFTVSRQNGAVNDERGTDVDGWPSGKIGQECSESRPCFNITVIGNHLQGSLSGNNGPADALNNNLWYERNTAAGCRLSTGNQGKDGRCAVQGENVWDHNLQWQSSEQAIGTPVRAPAGWSSVAAPDSLVYPDVPDWWCAEACDFGIANGIGAWGDDSSQGYCKLPAQIMLEGGSCTPLNSGRPAAPFLLPE